MLKTMKNEFLAIWFYIFITTISPLAFGQSGPCDDSIAQTEPYCDYWVDDSVTFVMGKLPPLVNNISIETEQQRQMEMLYLRNVARLWNSISNFSYNIIEECSHGDSILPDCSFKLGSPEGDGKNSIMFNQSPPTGFNGRIGVARKMFSTDGSQFCTFPRSGSRLWLCNRIEEVNIYIDRRAYATLRDISSCPATSSGGTTPFIEQILMHEIGHALGPPLSG